MAKSNKVGFLIAGLALLGAAIFAFKPKETTGGGSTPPPGGGSTPPPGGGSTPPPGGGSTPSTFNPTSIIVEFKPKENTPGSYELVFNILANIKNNSNTDLLVSNLNASLDFIFIGNDKGEIQPAILNTEIITIPSKKADQVLIPVKISYNSPTATLIWAYIQQNASLKATLKGSLKLGDKTININKVLPITQA